jgi:hypothetical protein
MYFNIHMVMLLTFILVRLGENKIFNVERREIQLIKEQRRQYDLMEQRSNIPRYGICWSLQWFSFINACR